ncbi:hypothetical protein BDR26DRAFT_854454 [Obelidium mucronatum]|nr:hypothetical protein BDR26DRAFT_854454 [Obelidium mucronatum]
MTWAISHGLLESKIPGAHHSSKCTAPIQLLSRAAPLTTTLSQLVPPKEYPCLQHMVCLDIKTTEDSSLLQHHAASTSSSTEQTFQSSLGLLKTVFPQNPQTPSKHFSRALTCGGRRGCQRDLKSSKGTPALYYAALRCGDALCDTSAGISLSECSCSDPNAVCAASINGNAKPFGGCCIPSQTCSGKCGAIDDGCGGTLNCAPCCIPKTCSSLGLITGSTSISDGCAGQISCGCSGGRSLQPDGSCCTPKTCSSFGFNEGRMFMASNGCGSTIPCSCPNGQTLVNGDCKAQCIPTTKYPDASMNCGYVDDGCGGSVQLATCSIPGQVCGAFKPNTCGTPLKDSDYVSLLVADVINLSPTCAASCLTNVRDQLSTNLSGVFFLNTHFLRFALCLIFKRRLPLQILLPSVAVT